MKKFTYAIIALVCLCQTGCITPWEKTTGALLGKAYRYRMDIPTPQGWYVRQINRMMLLTRHGTSLEYIVVNKERWNDTLSNDRALPQTLLLHEIPEIVLAEFCAEDNAYDMQITSNEITIVDSLPCASIRYSFIASNSLRMKGILFCIPFGSSFTVLMYAAEESVYYDKSYSDFLAMVSSAKIREKSYRVLPGIILNTGRADTLSGGNLTR